MAAEYSDFKYTRDPDRKRFTSHTYPLALNIIDAIQRIPWDEYLFEGEATYEHSMDVNGSDSSEDCQPITVMEEVTIPVTARYNAKHVPYVVFGGACYEWLNYSMPPQDRFLSHFTDPTGDLDVQLRLPYIEHEPIYVTYKGRPNVVDLMDHHYIRDKPNQLLTHLLQWVTRKITIELRKGIIPTDQLVKCDPPLEGTLLAPPTHLGNGKIWVTQQFVLGMTKIQITCQFVGMTAPDHIVEFVIPPGKKCGNFLLNNAHGSSYQVVNGLRIQTFDDLFDGNRDSLMNRTPETTHGIEHKYFNHVERLKFLNMYCSNDLPIHTLPCYLFLLLYLIKDHGWHVFVKEGEAVDNKLYFELYGNVLRRLTEFIETPSNTKCVIRMNIELRYCLHSNGKTKDFVNSKIRPRTAVPAVDTLDKLIALFQVPVPVHPVRQPFHPESIRTSNGHECAIAGGTKRRRKKRRTKRFKV